MLGLYLAVGTAFAALVGAFSSVIVSASAGKSSGTGTMGAAAFMLVWVTAPVFVARQYAIELYADERVRPHVAAAAERLQPVADALRSAGDWAGESLFDLLVAVGV